MLVGNYFRPKETQAAIHILLSVVLSIAVACGSPVASDSEDAGEGEGEPPSSNLPRQVLNLEAVGQHSWVRLRWDTGGGLVDAFEVRFATPLDPDVEFEFCSSSRTLLGSVTVEYFDLQTPRIGCYYVYTENSEGRSEAVSLLLSRSENRVEVFERHTPRLMTTPAYISISNGEVKLGSVCTVIVAGVDDADLYITNHETDIETLPYFLTSPSKMQRIQSDVGCTSPSTTSILTLGTNPVDEIDIISLGSSDEAELIVGNYYGVRDQNQEYGMCQ